MSVYEMIFDYGYDRSTGGVTVGFPVGHSSEIPFVFATPLELDPIPDEPSRVAQILGRYWGNFAPEVTRMTLGCQSGRRQAG